MSTFTRKINYLTIWFLLGVFSIGAHAVASEFYKEVAASATPTDYESLISFSPPIGAGTGRQTYIKFVTDTALADLNFRIEPQNPGVNGNRSPVNIQVLGTGGADAIPKSMAEDDALATSVVDTMLAQEVTGTNVAGGYKMIVVRLDYADTYTFPALAETWQLKVKETTNDREYFGFAGETDAEVTQPRIETLPPIAFGDVQQGVSSDYAPVMPVNVRNIGTSTLTITGAPISGNPTPIFFTVDVFAPQPLDPGGSMDNVYDEDASDGVTEKKGIWIMASPGNLAERNSTLTLQSATDSETVTLSAAGVNLYAHILMDVSGSMGWHPDGSSPVSDPDQDSRLAKAKEAGKEVNNWIKEFSDGRAYLGLSTFPDSFTTADSDIVVGIDTSQNTHPSIQVAFGPQNLNGLKDRNGTPMDTGIITAMGDMDARINDPTKSPSSAERPDLKQAILLLSDGGETSGNARGQLGALDSKDILMYTIGYGTGNLSVDHVLLQDLANGVTLDDGTKGAFFDANSLDAFALKNAFKNAVTDWLGLRTIVDPEGTIRRGTTETHTACIDDSVYGLTFSVDWDRHVLLGVQLTLTSPTGEVITPQSSDISYYNSDSFAMYIIRGKRLRGGQGAGEWTMKLTGGNGIPASADTHYSYNVLAQSPVITKPKFGFESLGTATEFLFELQMVHLASDRLNNLKVTVDIDAPAESLESYLVNDPSVRPLLFDSPVMTSGNANAQSTGEAYKPHTTAKIVPKIIMGEPATLRQRMAYALAHFADKPFANKRATQSLELYDDGTHGDRVAHDGIFSAKSPTIKYDGIYKWYFKVESIKPGRKACVNREFVVWKYADVALSSVMMASQLRSAEVTQQEILDPGIWEHLKEKVPSGYQRKAVVFTPKDAIGNSWGMGRAKQVAFSVEDATTLGPVEDNLDGSYVQVIQFKAGDSPKVRVNAGGVVSEPVTVVPPTPPYWWLIWLVIVLVIIVIVYLVRRRNA